MRAGLVLLTLSYILSQFFRSFLAVLSEVLEQDLGALPDDLATASGVWFLVFAAMQIPVGAALDRVGPRRTAALLFLLGGAGGAIAFALAQTPMHVILAMGLIGFGCSPVLMASYYIFARVYSPAVFASLAATVLGIGTLGNLAGTVPLTLLVEAIGWREALWGLAAVTALIAGGIFVTVEDPPKVEGDQKGSVLDLLRMPALWLIFPMMFVNYAASGGLRAVWIGPYLRDVYGLDPQSVGIATLIMGVAMIAGTFAYGPLDRILGTRKWVVIPGSVGVVLGCAALWLLPVPGMAAAVVLFCVVGFFGMAFPLIIAHGRSFVPPHLAGRGVTLMNLFGIGGIGTFQVVTVRVQDAAAASGSVAESYGPVFAVFTVITLAGLIPYLFSRDRLD
ncbi:MFS transporter [Primorskyibacter aestuariivivens]|uniref:MFS transporter n=1 Tax=Primorskyibacter aestuariivivens TaxID=1888912 RepID=UPI0023007EA6|nr:MFS transporter [Primorskyibacter aestuariivivens]MDA7428333.1 MFS transporter [Primorskyibacter aestuariivivens]